MTLEMLAFKTAFPPLPDRRR